MTTYDDLIAYGKAASYSANRATVDELPRMVGRAENYVIQRLDHDYFADEDMDLTIQTNGRVEPEAFSDRFLEIRSFSVNIYEDTFVPLLPRAQSMLDTLFVGEKSAVPGYYARLKNLTYKVYPQPYQPIGARIKMNVKPPRLNASNQFNILTERFPEVIEAAMLREIAVFNIDPPQIAMYEKEVMDKLNAANAQVSRLARDEAAQRPAETRNITGS